MDRYRFARLLFLSMLIGGLIQSVYYYPLLPDRVAIHFDANGTPNGWGSKQFLVSIDIGLYLFLYTVFRLIRKVPSNLINMPNKKYWFAPERAQKTRRIYGLFLDIFGFLTLVFIFTLAEMTYRLNIKSFSATILNFWPLFWSYMALIFICTIWFYIYFGKKPGKG